MSECYLCGEPTAEDNWCFGCRHHICDDHPCTPWGRHEPEDHDDEDDE